MRELALALFLFPLFLFAQTDRYKKKVFNDYTVAADVVYGKSVSQAGINKNLTMDVYQPKGDVLTKRPLVILAHGGYFFFGDKEDFQPECEQLAKAGYVAVSINYRLIDVDDDSFYVAKRAVIDAIADMKAAVRFFYKDAANGNKYHIDTSNIFIGGYSAGAITSLHYAYANTDDDIKKMGGTEIVKYLKVSGGLEGKSGNPGYSTKIRGVINIAGALFNASMVDKNEPVLLSVHGTEDDIVPYNEGLAGTTKVTTQGSGLIHKRADQVGLHNELITLNHQDHFGFLDCEYCMDEIMAFIYRNLKK